ncbi:hypothetical protein [Micromonospora sp. NPDC047740]|uniref:hypothetical protein n=1 Tax=Micromonospora sp. NPDC047740 TaxID=3364254 RepID=UPI003716FB18
MTPDDGGAVTWWQCEPRRLARDEAEIGEWFPGLQWVDEGAGGWVGRLPRWPFDRPEPAGLPALVGEEGLEALLVYGHAYPMVAPLIYPGDPRPGIAQRTDHKWHVNGNGSLCLLQDDATWNGRGSVLDLLLKAAGWRVEYALMKAGVIEAMTLHGIVDDAQSDHLIAVAVKAIEAFGDQPAERELDGAT